MVLAWCFTTASGIAVMVDGTMKFAVIQKILKEIARILVCNLMVNSTWVMQENDNLKHISKVT